MLYFICPLKMGSFTRLGSYTLVVQGGREMTGHRVYSVCMFLLNTQGIHCQIVAHETFISQKSEGFGTHNNLNTEYPSDFKAIYSSSATFLPRTDSIKYQ